MSFPVSWNRLSVRRSYFTLSLHHPHNVASPLSTDPGLSKSDPTPKRKRYLPKRRSARSQPWLVDDSHLGYC